MKAILTSAPGKIILFGEHAVNRGQPALAAAIDLRVRCRVTPRADHRYSFRTGERHAVDDREGLLGMKLRVDAMRAAEQYDAIRALAAADFFAPARYVLAHVVDRFGGPGLDIEWRSDLPIGSGLGSGAAQGAALACAACRAAGVVSDPTTIAHLAWQGDVIAHGGVASGLDSGACALGGLTRYTVAQGPEAVPLAASLSLVIGDTLVHANTAEVNTRVRRWLAQHPERMHLFSEIGFLAGQALLALERSDLETLGHLMNMNQILLEKIGVSSPEIDALVEAGLRAGALGAKLSGSGGGGIVVLLTRPEEQRAVAEAITSAGGRAIPATTGTSGARDEAEAGWDRQPVSISKEARQ